MEQEKNKNGIIVLLVVIIIILAVLCVLFATDIISFKSNNTPNEDVVDVVGDDNTPSDTQVSENFKTINLVKENESLDYDNLHLDFKGTVKDNEKGNYHYVLDVSYNNQAIDQSFFHDTNNYRIWSSNMAASFTVYHIDNVYILISSIARQCFVNEIMIINSNKEVLGTYPNANYNIDGKIVHIETSDNGQCMGEDYESHITEYNYVVEDAKIVKQ